MAPAATSGTEHDDDPEELPCYRHPNRLTALQCIECERPICTECAVAAAVGFKCPDDARVSRAARAAAPPVRIAMGTVAALVVAVGGGLLLALFGIGFLLLFIAFGLGALVGIVARRASGGYRDQTLANLAAGAAALGMLLFPALDLLSGSPFGVGDGYRLLAGVIAAAAAHQRALH